MKLRDEICERWGWDLPDDEVWYETDDNFVMNNGMGWNRNTEIWWRNNPQGYEDVINAIKDKEKNV